MFWKKEELTEAATGDVLLEKSFLEISEAVDGRFSVKKVFLEIP